MNIIHVADIPKVPASHEDPRDPGVLKQVLLRRDDIPVGRIQMVNWATIPPGKSFRLHRHENMTEICVILEGTAQMKIDNGKYSVTRGDTFVIPSTSFHSMINLGAQPVLYLVIGVVHE
ncbi:cupin domain-containing protein [Candidatus Gottesmanbacteria bacterium]|nr:cupin domain-containing protein [Candidatus Gottesmanbacteria bacterium]